MIRGVCGKSQSPQDMFPRPSARSGPWREVEDTMKSKVWPDLDEMYPKDLEVWLVELFLQTLTTSIG